MIDGNWTPAPLEADRNGLGELALFDSEERNVLHSESGIPQGKREATAERLTACYNACEGIGNPEAIGPLLDLIQGPMMDRLTGEACAEIGLHDALAALDIQCTDEITDVRKTR